MEQQRMHFQRGNRIYTRLYQAKRLQESFIPIVGTKSRQEGWGVVQ